MKLSVTAKESIKTALAMTIAYGIALSMDWDTPMWAGFSVAFVSLPMTGHSLNKSAMRMLGTMVAAIASLSIIALFPQDRWLFISALSVYVGFCTYMMGAARYQYFWFVSGYVCIIVTLEAGPSSVNAFDLAILRTQETGLGILVYSVVAAVLWRRSSVGEFNAATLQLNTAQHELYRKSFDLMTGQGVADEVSALVKQDIVQQTLLETLFSAAKTDSHEIGRQRRQWRQYMGHLSSFNAIMARWHDSYTILKTVDKHQLIPGLSGFDDELEQRFKQIKRMLEYNSPTRLPRSVDLRPDKTALQNLPHFQQSALLKLHANLKELEQVTRALFSGTSEIRNFSPGPDIEPATRVRVPVAEFAFDIERLASVVQITAVLWLTFLAFIYVNDLPGGIFLIVVSGVIGMFLAANPQSQVSSMYMPFTTSVLFCTVLYAFIMPQLTSFIGLGIMIFAVTFMICYRYSSPQQGMGRAAGLAVFVTMIAVENHQTYNILMVYNTVLVFIGMFIVFQITAYVPFSPRPEQAFMRLQNRFFHSCEYLVSRLSATRSSQLSFWEQRRRAFHLHEVRTLPDKIHSKSKLINTREFPGSSKKHIDKIITLLQVISMRIQVLLGSRTCPGTQSLIDELLVDGQAWRITLQEAFKNLSDHLPVDDKAGFSSRLTEITGYLEARIEKVLKRAESKQLNETDRDDFYHLIGAYRGVSDALLEYSGNAELIDWEEWREARF